MKQTAVEWLINQLGKSEFNFSFHQVEIEHAKEMFEKQLREAWDDGRYENTGCGDSEAYYETFYTE